MNEKKPLATKTTTVGIKLKDYVVLAADKRATAGVYIAHKKVEKIHMITDYMAMTISGLVADAQRLVDEARVTAKYYELSSNMKPSVKIIAVYLANILSSYLRLSPFIVQLVVGGFDTEPRLYYIDLFGSLSEEDYIATGSGSPTAIGVLERNYSKDMSLEDAINLAKEAIKAAIGRDIFSGEGIDVVVIGKEGSRKETVMLS
ncbi:archaeal proteasome endopeptidase complex subunit beta [Desulfurococcaceae archaeon MEX13E-LK6-19]|nr:archaeal proteasome endopeptidase complex subunit beta [Desulfurococcaceae archaeon MEX13E-LK6-19]